MPLSAHRNTPNSLSLPDGLSMHDRANLPKLLIVDDERVIAQSLATIFSGNGYEAKPAYSAEHALEIISEWEPAIAILDVILPAMSGIDLAILLKASNPSIKVMLISGQIVPGTLVGEAAKQGHAFEILAKPIEVPELLGFASRLLATN
jgi:DNA-binding NtrC family response regulator